jgi:hypothetical protein
LFVGTGDESERGSDIFNEIKAGEGAEAFPEFGKRGMNLLKKNGVSLIAGVVPFGDGLDGAFDDLKNMAFDEDGPIGKEGDLAADEFSLEAGPIASGIDDPEERTFFAGFFDPRKQGRAEGFGMGGIGQRAVEIGAEQPGRIGSGIEIHRWVANDS